MSADSSSRDATASSGRTDSGHTDDPIEAAGHPLAAIADGLPGAVFQYRLEADGSSAFPYSSQRATQLLELTPQQLARDGQILFARIHPNDFEAVAAAIAQSASALTPWQQEFRVHLPNAGVRWLRNEASVQQAEDGAVIWNGYLTDITDGRSKQDALETIGQRLEIATDGSGLGVWDLDLIADSLVWDRMMHAIYGTDPDHFTANFDAWYQIAHPDDRDRVTTELQALIDQGKEFNTEFRITRVSDGAQRWLNGQAVVLRHDDGTPYRVVGINDDITQRKATETALIESEERFRGLFEAMDQGVVVQRSDGAIIDANPAAERILGLTRDQMMGRVSTDPNWRAIDEQGNPLPGEEHPISHALRTGQSVAGTMGVHRPDEDQPRWLHVDAHPRIRPGETKPYQGVAVFTDITQARAQAAALEAAREQAVAANHAKSTFLATMSHEIRTPMNGILGTAELLLNGQLDEDQRELSRTIVESGESLLTIINDILDFSRIESGKMTVEWLPVDIAAVISATIKPLRSRLDHGRVELRLDGLDQAGWYIGDPHRLRQVLTNLVGNAIKFTHDGHITVAVSRTERETVITVADTGIGIDTTRQRALFQPFEQADNSTARKFGGTGLGLAISRRLVELMQGRLELSSSLGEGAAFSVHLPWRACDLSELQSGTQQIIRDKAVLAQGWRILVAEDNGVNQLIVRRMLEAHGAEVALANDGAEAVDLALGQPQPDLVLMDIQMPGTDGYEATQRIRQHEQQHGGHLPIVALTANAMAGDRERCLDAGMDDYLAKPLRKQDLAELLLRIRDRVGAN